MKAIMKANLMMTNLFFKKKNRLIQIKIKWTERKSKNTNATKDKEEKKNNDNLKTKEKKYAIFNQINKDHKKYKPWAALAELNKDYSKYVKCNCCNTEMLIQSLYGQTWHLKSSTHIDKEKEHSHDTNKNKIIDKNVGLINDSNCKRIKMIEYDFCNLLTDQFAIFRC